MAMILGTAQLSIQIPEAHSLKDRRRVVKSIVERVRARFDVAIAEIDDQQYWQSARIGLVAVSNSSKHVDEVVQQVIGFVEQNLRDGYLSDVQTEILHVGR
jgi:uncharacterized protein YlxP (DUF503 family)